MAGDEETGDDEEDIDADESTDEAIRPQMVEQDDPDGQGPQTLNIGAES